MIWNPDIKLIEGEMHRYFLRMAYKYAWENSHDPVTKNGAIIVDLSIGKVIAYGTNHFPEGLDFTEEQTNDREWKYKYIIHAERDVVENAETLGKNIRGFTMYLPWAPCKPCAEKIINAGVGNLIGHKAMIMKTPERWWDSINSAFKLLEKNNVGTYMYDGKIGGIENLFDGSEWEP